MLDVLMQQCIQNIETTNCCHNNGRECNCYECLTTGFREEIDEYDCIKKMNYYVVKYGYSYASEIYQYLSTSRIIEQIDNQNMKILSLGCGFSPDYFAIQQYITDNGLNIEINYTGYDNSSYWDTARIVSPDLNYYIFDLTNQFSFDSFDIIMISKVFSTMYKHNSHTIFLKNLANAVIDTMQENSYLIFNDINSINMGRDVFSREIDRLFIHKRKFYVGNPPYIDPIWTQLNRNCMVFHVVQNEGIDPINELRHNVFFEYRK